MYGEQIRATLDSFYRQTLPTMAERTREETFRKMDRYDAENPGQSAYALKSKLYETIAETIQPVIFKDIPFFFETGALVPFCDGRYSRGGIHANGWLYLRNQHLFEELDPETYSIYQANKKAGLYYQTGVYTDMMHIGLPLKKLFRIGLTGIYEQLCQSCEQELTQEEAEFFTCAKSGILALKTMACKFAEAAEKEGMEELAETARRIPWKAPQTFHEGLCAMAFIRKALGALEGVGFSSFGRVDVLLAPLYENDIARGVSQEDMLDDLCKFLLIWHCTMDQSKPVTVSEYEMENTLTLGGCDETGQPVFNGVTRLFLRAREITGAIFPKMMLRYSASSSQEYLTMITSGLLEGKSLSLFENDDCMIPALIHSGIFPQDAANYVVGGCWDALTPDQSNKFSGEYVNVLKVMEWAVHQDTQKMKENAFFVNPWDTAESFDELYDRYLKDIRRLLLRKAEPMAKGSAIWHKVNPCSALSALMEPCIEKRKDITAGGGKYNWDCVYYISFADAVDSLLAIRQLCFQDKVCTLPELLEACRQNWPDEALRQKVIHAASYGDGSEDTNRFAANFWEDLYRLSRDLPTAYGGEYFIGSNLYTNIVWTGKATLATPNGRRHGDYICQGLTPSRLQRPTSAAEVLKSLACLDLSRSGGNCSVNMTLPAGKINQTQLVQFFRAAAHCGIQALQINCVNQEDLLKAQKDPENYRHIIVRVCGLSAPFVLLSPTYQEEFLSRMFHDV